MHLNNLSFKYISSRAPPRVFHIRSADPMQLSITNNTAGLIEHEVNNNSFSSSQPCVKRIKASIDQAVHSIYGDQAHVELQGSVGKATGIANVSDLDFFVMLAKDISHVTRSERKVLMDKVVEANPYTYRGRLGEHRIQLIPEQGGLPSVDIVFERFKTAKPRDEPNASLKHEVQIVTKYLKSLPYPSPGPHSLLGGYTNLPRTGYELERFVVLVLDELASSGLRKVDLIGSHGVALILQSCLEKIGKSKSMTANQFRSLEESGCLVDEQWSHAANKCLNKLARL
jgi:hypothetical protein